MGHTRNTVLIRVEINRVFDITNAIGRWHELFSEYKTSTVINQEGNRVIFKLETYPDKEGHVHSWISERIIDREKFRCTARRLEPAYPFEYMHITWEYSEMGSATLLTWIQDFKADKACPWDDKRLEEYINHNSKIQMKAIREKIENGFAL